MPKQDEQITITQAGLTCDFPDCFKALQVGDQARVDKTIDPNGLGIICEECFQQIQDNLDHYWDGPEDE